MIYFAVLFVTMLLLSFGYPVWHRWWYSDQYPPKCFRSQPQGEEMLTNGCAQCAYNYFCLTLAQRIEARSLEYRQEIDQ